MGSIILKTSFRILTKISTLRYQVQKCQAGVQCSFVPRTLSTQCEISSNLHLDDCRSTEFNSGLEAKQKYSSTFRLNYSRLQNMLFISVADAKDLLKRYPKLKACRALLSENNYRLYIKAGIKPEVIYRYPMLLTVENLQKKIEHIQQLTIDLNLIAPLFLAKQFFKIVDYAKLEEAYVPYGNRILYLSHLFNLDSTEIAEKCMKHMFVFSIPLYKLEEMLKLLFDYGVEPQNIINDCWALRYNVRTAEERFRKATESNVPVKTWMIRCPNSVFIKCLNRKMENRKILGTNSTEEYLSKRLECTLENATYLMEKYPAIMKMSMLKMKEILDYLYEQGYSPTHVCRVPRILVHSQETTKVRIQQLRDLGYVSPSLAIFCKSKRDFDKLLKKYVNRKKAADLAEECSLNK